MIDTNPDMNLRTVLSNPGEHCLTFVPRQGENYFGYRFLEGEPLALDACLDHSEKPAADWGEIPTQSGEAGGVFPTGIWKSNWLTAFDTQDPTAPAGMRFQTFLDGSAHCLIVEETRQQEFFFQPAADGIQVWLRFTAFRDIPASYCIQQCLRFTGQYNADWRKAIACIPYLSELDMQAMGNPNGTLTYMRAHGNWVAFPVAHTVYSTQSIALDLPALSSEIIDHGLIVRETPDRSQAPASYFDLVAPGTAWDKIAVGMYWERTILVSNRQPADCTHSWIDIGPLRAGQSRIMHGKIYFLEGSKQDVFDHWRQDFSPFQAGPGGELRNQKVRNQ